MVSKETAIGLIVVIVVLFGCFMFKKKEVADISRLLNRKQDSVKIWKDKYGKEHATLQQAEESYQVSQILHKKENDSLAKVLGINAGNIRGVTKTVTKTEFTVLPGKVDTVYYPDTSGAKRIRHLSGSFTDHWLHASAQLGDTSWIKGIVTDTTNVITYTRGFFNAKTYLDVTHNAPYVKTNDIKSYMVKEPTGGLDVSIFAGGGYNVSSIDLKRPQVLFGVGISKRLFSIGKK